MCRALPFLVLLGACTADPEVDPDLIATQQFVRMTSDRVYYEFFLGRAVVDEVAATGTFMPTGDKRYSMVRAPVVLAPSIGELPTTVSMCDPDNDILIHHQSLLDQPDGEDIRPDGSEWPDPHITYTDTLMIQTYRAGDTGVYGRAQLHRRDAALGTGVAASFLIPFGDGHEGYRTGGMLLGWLVEDPVVDDPLLETTGGCEPPSVP